MQFLSTVLNFIKGAIHVDFDVTIESGDTFAASFEISMEVVKQITENEAAYVWSSFWDRAVAIDDLIFSHVDSDGVPGYRIAGTSCMVWRNELYPVALPS